MILFWGSLWGIAEATLGYVLHMAAIAIPGLPGFLMFPVVFYFMRKVYLSTGKINSVFNISVIAALIKLTDFFIPGNIPLRIINPSLCILLEGLAVSLVFCFFHKRKLKLEFFHSFMMGFIWRGSFLIYLYIISLFNLPAALVTNGIFSIIKFLVFESLVNCLLIYAYLKVEKTDRVFKLKPVYAYGAFIMALAGQLIL